MEPKALPEFVKAERGRHREEGVKGRSQKRSEWGTQCASSGWGKRKERGKGRSNVWGPPEDRRPREKRRKPMAPSVHKVRGPKWGLTGDEPS